jgi:putative hemolysin
VRASDEPPVTQDEITQMVRQGVDAGVFLETEHEMVEGVFRLDARRVASLMTPRTEVVWLDIKDTEEENRKKIIDSHFSRYPVCEGDLDHVIGVIATKDVLSRMLAGESFDIRAAMREPIFVPEGTNAAKLLDIFRKTGKHSAFVIGEYGGFEGMITIQDILEDIVGDIDEPQIVQREDGSWLIDGMIPIDDFKDLAEIEELPGEHESFNTLAGFVITIRGEIPKTGDTFNWEGFHFEIVDMDGNRIDKVLVTPPPKPKDEDDKEE